MHLSGCDLLGHFGDSFKSVKVLHVVLLELDDLDAWLLSEELNRDALVVKSYLTLLAHGLPSKGILDTACSVFVFLDGADQLVSCFDIDLSCLYNLLQDLRIFLRQVLMFL